MITIHALNAAPSVAVCLRSPRLAGLGRLLFCSALFVFSFQSLLSGKFGKIRLFYYR